MIATALRQLIILLPTVYLIGKVCGINAVWFAFWISEIVAFVYALYEWKRHISRVI